MSNAPHLIHLIQRELQPFYPEGEAHAIARMIAEDRFGISLTQVYASTARQLSTAEMEELHAMIRKLQMGMPVQYVLGKALFMGLSFEVSPGVLIPRPETEDLVTEALALLQESMVSHPEVADAGCGSGCIGIAVKCLFPSASVTAFDLSPLAVSQTRRNAALLGADIRVTEANLLLTESLPTGPFHLIISNPPYVTESERENMDTQVKDHEPELALFVPDHDALRHYRALGTWGLRALRSGGHLLAEINSSKGAETEALFAKLGYTDVVIKTDRFNKERILLCQKP